MGTWIDDYNPSPAARAKLGELDAEWPEIDRRFEAPATAAEREKMLGRIDELEYEIDELVRSGSGHRRDAADDAR